MKRTDSKLWKEIHQQSDCIKECLKYNIPEIKKIADEIKERNIQNIIFAARGSSDHACKVAKYLFEIYTDKFVTIGAESTVTCYETKANYKNACVIGISQSGGAKDVYAMMEKCVNDGGLCISITNEPDCLMSKIGDYRLNNHCGEETSITAAKSYITQLTILTALVAYVSKDEELLQVIDELPEIVNYAYSLENQVLNIIPAYRNTSQIMILGRGLLYGLVQESELKIQETCYLDARCYAASDYQHGPIATALRFVPTLFFIADQKTNQSIVDLHARLKKEKKIYSTIITNDETIASYGNQCIIFDKKYDGIRAVYVSAVISQMFACLLSLSRGYNPDSPDGVSKHTVTI